MSSRLKGCSLAKRYVFSSFSHKKAESIREAILKTSFINLFARLFGYLKQLSIAILFGFNYHTDAFFMALSIIGIFLIFVDVFDSLGIPNLVSAKEKSEEEFKKLTGLLLSFTTILAISLTILSFLLYPFLSKIAVGFDQKSLESLKVSYFLLLPYLFSKFFFHHFGAVLRSLRRFTFYFIGEFIFSFFSFIFITLGLWLFNSPLTFPIATSLANIIATTYMVLVGKEFLHFKLYLDEKVKPMLRQFLYLLALYGVFHLFTVVDRAFASLVGEKGVSALTYGFLLAFALRGVIKLEHMAITALSESKASLIVINKFLKLCFFVSIPSTTFLFFFSEILVRLFFGHGKFQTTDVALTSEAVRFYSLSLFFAFAWPILYRAFQVMNYLKPVFFVALFGVIANGVANYVFVVVYSLGIAGICFGTLIAYALITASSYGIILWRKQNG